MPEDNQDTPPVHTPPVRQSTFEDNTYYVSDTSQPASSTTMQMGASPLLTRQPDTQKNVVHEELE